MNGSYQSSYTPLHDGFVHACAQLTQAAPWDEMQCFTAGDVSRALESSRIRPRDLLALLSPAAEPFLEHMARRAQAETLRQFGRCVQLFTPLYLANVCTNHCVYCGFNARRGIKRQILNLDQVEAEAKSIAATGLRRILALTGDAPAITGAEYLAACIEVLARYFPSVGVEVPSMTVEEYARIVAAGADSMTMFQETYNPGRYLELHPAGPKRDYAYRVDAPERAALGGMRAVNLGALLGLDDWRRDLFLTAMHADFLLHRYPALEVSISLPRMRPCGEDAKKPAFTAQNVSDRHFVQALTALRCFLPQAGITLSTREPAALRDALIPLGVTRVSAGVCTAVGGHTEENNTTPAQHAAPHTPSSATPPQFEISDPRSVDEMAAALEQQGFQPVYTDWLLPGAGTGTLGQAISTALGGQVQ